MTRKEAIARIKEHKFIHKMKEPRAIFISEALDMAIEALEQKPVLDKIRAEIEEVANQEKIHDEKWALGLRYAVKIIDKYTEESEEV